MNEMLENESSTNEEKNEELHLTEEENCNDTFISPFHSDLSNIFQEFTETFNNLTSDSFSKFTEGINIIK